MGIKDIIILILAVLLLAVSILLIVFQRIAHKKNELLSRKLNDANERIKELDLKNDFEIAKYSDSVLEFIHKFTTEIAINKFHTFMDNHKMEMVTKTILEGLVKDTSEYINIHLNYDIILTDYSLFTKSYIEDYIIETVVSTIKNLFNNSVEENL